jgi:hypothetical protein
MVLPTLLKLAFTLTLRLATGNTSLSCANSFISNGQVTLPVYLLQGDCLLPLQLPLSVKKFSWPILSLKDNLLEALKIRCL